MLFRFFSDSLLPMIFINSTTRIKQNFIIDSNVHKYVLQFLIQTFSLTRRISVLCCPAQSFADIENWCAVLSAPRPPEEECNQPCYDPSFVSNRANSDSRISSSLFWSRPVIEPGDIAAILADLDLHIRAMHLICIA